MRFTLQKNEKILYQGRPSGKLLVLWFFDSIIPALFITLFIGIAFFVVHQNLTIIVPVSFVILLLIIFLYNIALIKTYEYYITTQRVIFKGGVISRKIKSIPLYKITDVAVSQGLGERMVGLASLNIQTAGSTLPRPEIQFVGLADADTPYSILLNQLATLQSSKNLLSG